VVGDLSREQWPVALELTEQMPLEGGVGAKELVSPTLPGVATAPPPHARADERQVLDRPDVRRVLEQRALLPQEAVELGRVVARPEPAVDDEVLRGRCSASRNSPPVYSLPSRERTMATWSGKASGP